MFKALKIKRLLKHDAVSKIVFRMVDIDTYIAVATKSFKDATTFNYYDSLLVSKLLEFKSNGHGDVLSISYTDGAIEFNIQAVSIVGIVTEYKSRVRGITQSSLISSLHKKHLNELYPEVSEEDMEIDHIHPSTYASVREGNNNIYVRGLGIYHQTLRP